MVGFEKTRKTMRNIALILAGGKGGRMLMPIPKQFVEVAGECVLMHTLHAFEEHSLISAIYIVCAPEWRSFVERKCQESGIHKVATIMDAGETSFASIKNGIQGICQHENADTIVLIHDGVRPLVSKEIISSNIAVCLTRGNAITALRSQEGFMVLENSRNESSRCVDRDTMLRAQTPHTFHLSEIKEMLEEASEKGIAEAQSLFTLANELKHTPLYVAQGEITNFKLTVREDLDLFQTIIRGRN